MLYPDASLDSNCLLHGHARGRVDALLYLLNIHPCLQTTVDSEAPGLDDGLVHRRIRLIHHQVSLACVDISCPPPFPQVCLELPFARLFWRPVSPGFEPCESQCTPFPVSVSLEGRSGSSKLSHTMSPGECKISSSGKGASSSRLHSTHMSSPCSSTSKAHLCGRAPYPTSSSESTSQSSIHSHWPYGCGTRVGFGFGIANEHTTCVKAEPRNLEPDTLQNNTDSLVGMLTDAFCVPFKGKGGRGGKGNQGEGSHMRCRFWLCLAATSSGSPALKRSGSRR